MRYKKLQLEKRRFNDKEFFQSKNCTDLEPKINLRGQDSLVQVGLKIRCRKANVREYKDLTLHVRLRYDIRKWFL